FNQVFHSALALDASYRDTRFIPHRWPKRLLLPILFSLHWQVADDLPFQDIRVGLAYVIGIVTAPLAFFRRKDTYVDATAVGALFAFAGVSYAVWVFVFGIYRYILALEMLAPLLIVGAIGLWPLARTARLALTAIAAIAILYLLRYDGLARAPVGDPYVQVTF